MADAEHALFSASKAPRWINCPGSIALEPAEKTSSRYADEGTAAHTLAALCLTEGQPTIAFAGRLIDVGPNRFEVDEDMLENVQSYVDYCNALRLIGDMSLVEHRVDYSACIGQPNSFGTSDFLCLVGTELIVVDLKYGMGVQVDATENEQLMLYALGALEYFELVASVTAVRLVIHQPRKSHLSEWETTPEALRKFAEHAATRAAYATMPDAADKFLVPGEKQCKFCPAKATCPAIRADVLRTIAPSVAASDVGFDDLTAEVMLSPKNPNDVLAAVLPKLDMISDWCDAVKTHARAELLNGREVPGYKLVTGRKGARAWTDATEAEKVMKSMRLKQDEMYDFSLISPTTAEKRLKDTPKRWNRISALIVQKDGAPTIAPASDNRPAIVIGDPGDAFEPVDQGADLV